MNTGSDLPVSAEAGTGVCVKMAGFMSEFSKGAEIMNAAILKYNVNPKEIIVTPFEGKLSFLISDKTFLRLR